jgi:hypothetical protein
MASSQSRRQGREGNEVAAILERLQQAPEVRHLIDCGIDCGKVCRSIRGADLVCGPRESQASRL